MENYDLKPPSPPSRINNNNNSNNNNRRISISLKEMEENLNFDGIDEDLENFKKDDVVKRALSKGIDLKGYASQIEQELREVEMGSVKEYVQQVKKKVHFLCVYMILI